MRTSLLGRVLLPPPTQEVSSLERRRQIALARAGIVAFAIAIDVALYLMLHGAPGLRPSVVTLFAKVNISLLGTSFLLTILFLRGPFPLYGAVQALCLLCEAGSMIIWIQMTGTVSSYFLIMGVLLILLYRLGFDYWLGLLCLILVVAFHSTAFTLEELHLLRPASLFVEDPGAIYSSPAFRYGAFSSILWCDVVAFFAANYLKQTMKEKERVLTNMRRDLDRAVEKVQVGLLSGSVLDGAYEVGELLGRGGMGEVYQGRRLTDGKEVAIKVLLSDVGQDQTVRQRFLREAEVIARLPAEHIAGFIEMRRSNDGHDFLVMELLRGEDLGSILKRRGRMGQAELLEVARGLAEALAAAHERQVIHRDLKPPNVFLDTDGHVRLLDFGIARLLESESARTLTMTAVVLGTPGYLAPEQARGLSHEVGPSTDVFAFGAILYRALTGRNAFPSRNPVSAAYEALCHHPAPPSSLVPDLSEDVDAVLALALAKATHDRYQDARHVVRDLALALEGNLPDEVRARGRVLVESAPTAEHTLETMAGRKSAS